MSTLIEKPLVSMIVLCYNQARFVEETLESIKAQTYQSTELILVDDCSTDESVRVIEAWLKRNAIKYTFVRHKENEGICRSLNEALSQASGKYISMIASDDIWLPNKIALQVEMMEARSDDVGVLYSDAFQIDGSGRPLPEMFIVAHRKLLEMPEGQILDTLVEGNFIPGMTTLIRRSCYGKVGNYDENLPWEDWDMWMRIARHYLFVYSPIPSAKYRCHPQSLSRSARTVMIKGSFKTCLKHYKLGSLNLNQKSSLIKILIHCAEELYRDNDPETSGFLLALWRVTGSKRARGMYLFSRLGISFRSWQKANRIRVLCFAASSGDTSVSQLS